MGRCSCCWYEQQDHKDFIRGGVGEDDFNDDLRYRHPKRRSKKSRARSLTRTPCPAADDGKHVYVWVPCESEWSPGEERVFYRHFGYHQYEKQVCCGCMATKGWRRETEEYIKVKERKWRKLTGGEFAIKRGEPVQRYRRGSSFYNFKWENYDEGYLKALAKWETTKEAQRLRREVESRRIEVRRRLFGYN